MKAKETSFMRRQNELNIISDVSDFIVFAQKNARIHTKFHHYTTVDSLLKIVENRTIKLSRSDKMNDLQELTKGNYEKWKRTYISSFCYGDSENIAMWTMYCIPWQKGVRISFSSKEFSNWIDTVKDLLTPNSGSNLTKQDVEDIVITDVIYSSYNQATDSEKIKLDSYKIIDSRGQFRISNFSSLSSITGFVKNRAWEYENETRIKVVLNKTESGCTDLFLPLSKEVLKTLEITFSPWASEKIILETVESLRKVLGEVSYSQSQFKNLINIKTKCSGCQKDFSEFAARD